MLKVNRQVADYVRNTLGRPDLIQHTVGKGKKKTYYCVEDTRVLRKIQNMI